MSQLVVETRFQRLHIVEDTVKDGGLLKISGVASQTDTVNRNGRVYPRAVMEREITSMSGNLSRSDRVGAVNHPSREPRIEDLALKFTKLWMEGNDVLFEAEILRTERGRDLEALIRGGVEIGISSRGYATVKTGEWQGERVEMIQDDYELSTYDAVVEPSVADARIRNFEAYSRVLDKIDHLMSVKPENLDAIDEIIAKVCAESAQEEAETPAEEPKQEDVAATTETTESETPSEVEPVTEDKWTKAYIDSLPDSAFLYVEDGGEKKDGKTEPLSLRHFPYKDDDGKVDDAHLRDALSRLDDDNSTLSADVREKIKAKADKIAKANGIEVSDDKSESEKNTETPTTESVADTSTTNESALRAELGVRVVEAEAKVEALSTELVEANQRVSKLESLGKKVFENSQSLLALLGAIKTALQQEIEDDDWNDLAFLSSVGCEVSWRQDFEEWAEEQDEDEDANDDADEAKTRIAANFENAQALKDILQSFVQSYRKNRLEAHIAQKVQSERFAKSIAKVLSTSATSIKDVDEQFDHVKERVQNNYAPTTTSRGTVASPDEDDKPRWTKEEAYQRKLLGFSID
jgi:hypothetical protein